MFAPYYSISDKSKPISWEQNYRFNSAGNPLLFKAGEKDGFHPVLVSQYALSCFDIFINSQSQEFLDKFFSQVKFLLQEDHYIFIDNKIGYPYKRRNKSFNLEIPWYSGMAQSQIISVLSRAYLITEDRLYLKFIKLVRNFLLCLDLKPRPLLILTPENEVWIEECASEPSSLILNGFIFSIIGLLDYVFLFPDDRDAKDVLTSCIQSLKKLWKLYDTGSWTYYCRFSEGNTPANLCDEIYMKVHVDLMKHMFLLTADDEFFHIYTKWKLYIGGAE